MKCYHCNTLITETARKVVACLDEGGIFSAEACSHSCALQISAPFRPHEIHIEGKA